MMNQGKIEVICGHGSGKTSLALGRALQALSRQEQVIMIQFLKGSLKQSDLDTIKRLEPELKVFRFEKSGCYFEDLSEAEKQEELLNIRNGLNYAKKVLATGECDLLILDEILGLVDQGFLESDELIGILDCRDEVQVLMTGQVLPDSIARLADEINGIEHLDVDNRQR